TNVVVVVVTDPPPGRTPPVDGAASHGSVPANSTSLWLALSGSSTDPSSSPLVGGAPVAGVAMSFTPNATRYGALARGGITQPFVTSARGLGDSGLRAGLRAGAGP